MGQLDRSGRPFASPHPLSGLSEELQHIIKEVDAVVEAPFASIEHSPDGPRLIVGGICVRWWMGAAYQADAETMAAQINGAFAARLAGVPHHST